MGLREQAAIDARAILEDTSGFAWPVTLTSPLGDVTALRGFTTDVGQTIDPETGQAVAGQRASFACARAALPALPEAVAESNRRPWLATFANSQGLYGTWKIVEVLPDNAAGVVVMLLEVYQRRIIIEGPFALPSLQLAGSIAPRVSLAGSFALPSLQLAGSIAPRVSLAGSLALPSLQLSGSITVGTTPVSSWLRLAASTINAGEYDTIANVLVPSNPTNQPGAVRKPAAATSANGLPVATWDGSDVLVWPIVASNNSTVAWGLMLWIKPSSNITARQRIFHGTFNSSAPKIVIDIVNGGIEINFFRNSTDGRNWQKANCLTASAWQCLRVQFDGAQSAVDDNAMQVFKNEVKITGAGFINIGAGGAMTALAAPSGSYLLGASQDADAPLAALLNLTQTGPNVINFNATPSAAAAAALMNLDVPT